MLSNESNRKEHLRTGKGRRIRPGGAYDLESKFRINGKLCSRKTTVMISEQNDGNEGGDWFDSGRCEG